MRARREELGNVAFLLIPPIGLILAFCQDCSRVSVPHLVRFLAGQMVMLRFGFSPIPTAPSKAQGEKPDSDDHEDRGNDDGDEGELVDGEEEIGSRGNRDEGELGRECRP